MKITLPTAELATVAPWIDAIVPGRPTSPPLGAVVLNADQPGLSLSAYDWETAGKVHLVATVDDPGTVLVSSRLLTAVAKTLGSRGVVELAHSGETLMITLGRSQWELPTLDPTTYPQLPPTGHDVAEIDSATFTAAIARVLPAVSDVTSGFQTAVALGLADGVLTIATTDRSRMAVAELACPGQPDLPEVLVPAGLLTRAPRGADTVRLRLSANGFGLASDTHELTGRRLEVSMPWRRIDMSVAGASHATTVDVAELRQALARASVVVDPEESITLTIDADGAAVRPTLGGRGRAEHFLEVVQHNGPETVIELKAAFLRDALDALDSPLAVLSHSDKPYRPVLIRPANADGAPLPGYRHVIAQQRMTSGKAAA